MRLLMAVLIFALVLVPAATEAESEKKEGISKIKIELMLDMSIEKVKELKGKPITQVNLDTTTVLSYNDLKLIFRDDKLVGKLDPWFSSIYMPLMAEEEMKIKMIVPSEIEKFKKTPIPSMRFGRAAPKTIELVRGMSIEAVEELKGKPNSVAKISGSIEASVSIINISHSLPKGQYHLYLYDDMMIAFLNGKLLTVR